MSKGPYLSPFPSFERELGSKDNTGFKTNIETLIHEMTFTLDNLNSLVKELEFTRKEGSMEAGSMKNVSNLEANISIKVN